MDLRAVEKAITDRLRDELGSGYKVQAWPDDAANFTNLAVRGAVLVRFDTVSIDEPEKNRKGSILQESRQEWVLSIIHSSLTSQLGAYDLIALVRTAISGYELSDFPGSTKFAVTDAAFVRHDPGMWQYDLRIFATFPEYSA